MPPHEGARSPLLDVKSSADIGGPLRLTFDAMAIVWVSIADEPEPFRQGQQKTRAKSRSREGDGGNQRADGTLSGGVFEPHATPLNPLVLRDFAASRAISFRIAPNETR